MSDRTRGRFLAACLGCFLLGWLWGQRGSGDLVAQPPPAKAEAPAFPMSARLGANLYLQLSAEFRACCLQIYRCAGDRLETMLATARPKPLKPAVVMDLDETVLDNSAFQTFLLRNKLEYSDALWAIYEEKHPQDVTLIPGARAFIDRAAKMGVTVLFISNRSEAFRKSTEAALERLGIKGPRVGGWLYLKPRDGSSDKAARREAAASEYNVLMYFGDNLRDFSEVFAAKPLPRDATTKDYLNAIKERGLLADRAAAHWGVDWFVLPNPVYGEWDKMLGPDPRSLLRPTSMEAPRPK